MKKTIMSNLTINTHIKADFYHDFDSINQAVGDGQKNTLDTSFDLLDEEEITATKNGGLLGEKAGKYITGSANLVDLPGDDDDDLDDDDEDDEIDLDKELEIETDEVDVESIEIDDEDPNELADDDDDDLDDDDDIL